MNRTSRVLAVEEITRAAAERAGRFDELGRGRL
jgi:hypothetical protein